MAELFEEVVTLLESRSSTRALAGQFRIESEQAASNGAVLCVPVFLSRLSDWMEDPGKSVTVLRTLRSIDTNGLQDPGAAFDGRVHEPVGSELVNMLLGSERRKVASVISGEAGISERSANGVLAPAAWAVVASIADRYGNRVDRQALLTVLNKEKADMVDGGWGPWLEATAPELGVDHAQEPASLAGIGGEAAAAGGAALGGAAAFGVPQNTGNYPPPVARNARQASADVVGPSRPQSRPQPAGTRSPTVTGPVNHRRPVTSKRATPSETRTPERRGSNLPAMLGVLALFLLGAGAVYWLTQRGDDTATGTGAVDAEAGDVAGADPEAEADAAEVRAEPSIDLTSEPVALDLIMFDPEGRSESTGVAELRFEPTRGKICYNITADLIGSPYDGHIHVGPAGVRGGIVVDFGALNNADIGCTTISPGELQKILNDQAGHYVEMHDPSGDFTIRAQLSEAMPDSGSGSGTPAVPADALFDPDGGGATTVIEAGRVVLRGQVADQATLDRLTAENADVAEAGLELVNELTIVEGAPLPSGIISIDNSVLFEVGSDELVTGDTSIADLAKLLQVRPTWTATVVGHTDSTGDNTLNFELSLRRANAVINELVAGGVETTRLTPRGDGSINPIGDNDTAEGRALNRRIEFIIDRG
ncbi:MAG: OmpA family protein [Acidimicrobiales bacterium]